MTQLSFLVFMGEEQKEIVIFNIFKKGIWLRDFPGGSDSEESACIAGSPGSIPGLGRSPGERKDYPLQYSCLENSMDRGAWQATVHGVTKSWTWTEQLTLIYTLYLELICNVVLISTVQQNDSVTHMHTFFFRVLFHYGLS